MSDFADETWSPTQHTLSGVLIHVPLGRWH